MYTPGALGTGVEDGCKLLCACTLGIERGASRRAAIIPKFWAISLASKFILFLRFSIRFSFFIFIVCLHVCSHTCTLVYGGQRLVPKSPLLHTLVIWSRASQSAPELAVTASLPRQLLWGSFVYTFLGWDCMWLLGPDDIYVNFGGPNFGPPMYIASALIPEPSPQPVMEYS